MACVPVCSFVPTLEAHGGWIMFLCKSMRLLNSHEGSLHFPDFTVLPSTHLELERQNPPKLL